MMIVVLIVLTDDEIAKANTNVLYAIADKLFPRPWSYLAVLATLLSTIGTLETQILQFSRSVFAMARDDMLHPRLANIHPKWRTPWVATLTIWLFGLLLLFGSSYMPSVHKILQCSIDAIGFQICFYMSLAGFACAWHYRKELQGGVYNAVTYVLWPLAAALFMVFIAVYSIPTLDRITNIVGIGGIVIGFVPLFLCRSDAPGRADAGRLPERSPSRSVPNSSTRWAREKSVARGGVPRRAGRECRNIRHSNALQRRTGSRRRAPGCITLLDLRKKSAALGNRPLTNFFFRYKVLCGAKLNHSPRGGVPWTPMKLKTACRKSNASWSGPRSLPSCPAPGHPRRTLGAGRLRGQLLHGPLVRLRRYLPRLPFDFQIAFCCMWFMIGVFGVLLEVFFTSRAAAKQISCPRPPDACGRLLAHAQRGRGDGLDRQIPHPRRTQSRKKSNTSCPSG